MPHTPETAQEALDRDITLADEHVDSVRDLFRRERDRLAAKPKSDPVRLKEWVAVLTALWAGAGEEVYVSTVTAINPDVEPGETPVFDSFIDKAAEGIFNTSRRRIKAVRALKPTNLSRQLRKLYQVEFIQKRAPRIALDQALRQTASFEDAAAKRVEAATGVPLEKVWHNQGDSRVRSTHLSVSSVLLADPFLVGGAELRYPRDPAGTGRETFGCRCWAEHREATEETLTPTEAPAEEVAPTAESQFAGDGELSGQAQVPDWNPDTGQFEGIRTVDVDIDVSKVPSDIRDDVERRIRRALDDYAPEFRPPAVSVVDGSDMRLGQLGAEYDSFGFKVGKDRVLVDKAFFNTDGWDDHFDHMIRHETGHRAQAVLVDRLERGGATFKEATQIVAGKANDVGELLRGLSDTSADELNMSYPQFFATRATGDLVEGVSVFNETFAEVVSFTIEGKPLPPELVQLLEETMSL